MRFFRFTIRIAKIVSGELLVLWILFLSGMALFVNAGFIVSCWLSRVGIGWSLMLWLALELGRFSFILGIYGLSIFVCKRWISLNCYIISCLLIYSSTFPQIISSYLNFRLRFIIDTLLIFSYAFFYRSCIGLCFDSFGFSLRSSHGLDNLKGTDNILSSIKWINFSNEKFKSIAALFRSGSS